MAFVFSALVLLKNLKTLNKVLARYPKLSLEKKFGQIHPTVTEKSGSENFTQNWQD